MLDTLRFIWRHPLARRNRYAAFSRFAQWQISSRLAPGPIAVPYVNGTRLLVSQGMSGATGNIYCGLHEFEDMAFTLHLLRSGDLLADVGANVGSFTVLAASRGAHVVAFEPSREARKRLEENVRLNDQTGMTDVRSEAVGASAGEAAFTVGRDTVNHLLGANEEGASEQVKVTSLDQALAGRVPTLVKIDVEGFEKEVLAGASRILASNEVLALIVEIWDLQKNGAGALLSHAGFRPVSYEPFTRTLRPSAEGVRSNTIFIRDEDQIQERLRSATPSLVLGLPL